MSTAVTSRPLNRFTRYTRTSSSHQCVSPGLAKPCGRKVVWYIRGVGYLCNSDYNIYMGSHRLVDVADIRRLSDNEEDFFGSNGGRNGDDD